MAARADGVELGRVLEVKFPECYAELDNPYRYKILYGGRGAARSWTVARKLLLRGINRKLLILCTRELQKSIAGSVYRLLKNQIKLLGLGYYYPDALSSGKTIVGRNGTEFIFMGTRYNADEIKSTEGIDIIWIEEAHNLTQTSWELIDPTIRKEDTDESGEAEWTSEIWATFNTRFKTDTLYDLFVNEDPPDDSLVIKSTFEDNPFLPKVLDRQQAELKKKDYSKWDHIWAGNLRLLAEGAIFGKAIVEIKKSKRYRHIPVEKSCEVDTFNDVGKNDPTAWWFLQNAGGQLRFIDYYHNRFQDIDHYVKVLKALEYNYGRHWMPHDADHDRLGMTRNIKEQFEDGGVRPVEIVDRVSDKEIGIQLARDIMGKCWFHHGEDDGPEEECEGYIPWLEKGWRTRAQRMEHGWEMLCHYRYKFNEDSQIWSLKPHHDIASNAADAFMQFAQSYEPPEHEDWFNKPLPEGRVVR